MTLDTYEISVIVGSQNARATIADCLKTLMAQAAGHNAEVIVVDNSTDGTADYIAAELPQVKLIHSDPQLLMPQLWRQGFEAAQGRIIAFTIAQCIPADDWLNQILIAHREEVAGIGGPIEGPLGSSGLDWGLYFSRYSAFLPGGPRRPVADLAGDNASYKHSALARCQAAMRDGFWETLVHMCLHSHNESLIMIPEAWVRLGPAGGATNIVKSRFRHGRHYGSTRPGNTLLKRAIRLTGSALIPAWLLARVVGRVWRQRPDWRPQLFRALPALTLILCAWALGEASGYLLPQASL